MTTTNTLRTISSFRENLNSTFTKPDQSQSSTTLRRLNSHMEKVQKYTLGKEIGRGAYAIVRIACNKDSNEQVAVKIYDKRRLNDPLRKASVNREIAILGKIHHPNIMKFHETFETANHLYLVTEFIPGISLQCYLKQKPTRRVSEDEARRLFKQLVQAVDYCHNRGIAHRDLKLENILLTENGKHMKIIDFGFATCMPPDRKMRIFCGTPSYMAPEIVNREEYYGHKADIWALGVLLFAITHGGFPFRGASDNDLYRAIRVGNYHASSFVSEELKALLSQMLRQKAEQRPSCREILQNPWLRPPTEIENRPCLTPSSTLSQHKLNPKPDASYIKNMYFRLKQQQLRSNNSYVY